MATAAQGYVSIIKTQGYVSIIKTRKGEAAPYTSNSYSYRQNLLQKPRFVLICWPQVYKMITSSGKKGQEMKW